MIEREEKPEQIGRRAFLRILSAAAAGWAMSGCRFISSPSENFPPAVPRIEDEESVFNEFESAYNEWKGDYLTHEGVKAEDQIRVKRPEDGNDTVSEGTAYGMIMAVSLRDKMFFSGLYNYAKSHYNQNGLMSWRILPDGQIPDQNSATDADLDMAYSLVMAARVWKEYKVEARVQIEKIKSFEIEPGTFVLKPGDGWGGSEAVNPSYFSPAYYQIFREYTLDPFWDQVAQKSREILDRVNEKTVLPPNWCTAEGGAETEPEMSEDSYQFKYEAIRVAFRQAMAVLWLDNKTPAAAHALSQLKRINSFFEKISPEEIVSGYDESGKPVGIVHEASFVGAAAIASIVSQNQNYRSEIFSELTRLRRGGYYNDSLRALALLLLSGKMPN